MEPSGDPNKPNPNRNPTKETPKAHCCFRYATAGLRRIIESDILFKNALTEAAYDGTRKNDYGNGLIKVALTGRRCWHSRNKNLESYVHWQAGYRVLGIRREIIEGVQQIEIFWFGHEKERKVEYNDLVYKYAQPLDKTSYFGGKPCNPRDDYNSEDNRRRIDSRATSNLLIAQ